MEMSIDVSKAYMPSEEVVAREIQGEFIVIPIASGIGDLEDELFTLNETGRAIWAKLDGRRNLKEIARDLSLEFTGSPEEIEKDVIGLTKELLKRRMLVETK